MIAAELRFYYQPHLSGSRSILLIVIALQFTERKTFFLNLKILIPKWESLSVIFAFFEDF